MSLDVQRRIREEAEDRSQSLRDLREWEQQMQKRDEELRQKKKRNNLDQAVDMFPPIRGSDKPAPPSDQEEKANSEKELGNNAFRRGKFELAAKHYTASYDHWPSAVALSNRAAAFLKLQKWGDAEKDCTAAINLATGPGGTGNSRELANASTVKAFYRRALARRELGLFAQARADLKAVLGVEPDNADAQKELRRVEQELARADQPAPAPTPAPAKAPTAAQSQQKGRRLIIEEADSDDEGEDSGVKKSPPQPKSALKQSNSSAVTEQRHVRIQVAGEEPPPVAEKQQPALPPAKAEETEQPKQAQVPAPPAARRIAIQEVDDDDEDEPPAAPSQPAEPVEQKREPEAPAVQATSKEPPVQQEQKHPEAAAPNARPEEVPAKPVAVVPAPVKAPTTFYEFEHTWRSICKDQSAFAQYLLLIDPAGLKALFGSNLSEAILTDILQALDNVVLESQPEKAQDVLRFLFHLANVPRFSELLLFLPDLSSVERILKKVGAQGVPEDKIDKVRRKYNAD